MKRTIKFILKLAVATIILLVVVFGICKLTEQNTNNLQIVEMSQKSEISQNLTNSYYGIYGISTNNENYYRESDLANSDVILGLVKVSNVLETYYDYYITLTVFENNPNAELKNSLISKIQELQQNIKETSRLYTNVKSQIATDNYEQINIRITRMFDAFCTQTTTLFEVCDLLKDYVYEVNYGTENCSHTYEAVLEIMKDYSKVAFDSDINKNIQGSSLSILNESEANSFSSVYTKFIAMTGVDSNSNEEAFITRNYMSMKAEYKTKYYQSKSANKDKYIESVENFTEAANGEESETDTKIREQEGVNRQFFMKELNIFLCQDSYSKNSSEENV
jgi:hypothetical protein